MPPELTAVLGTLLGVLLGGFVNYIASRSAKSHEWRLMIAREKATSRQKLYGEFLVEAQRLITKAYEDKISSLTDLNELNGKFAEISLVASEAVIVEAKKLADYALTSQSSQPAKEVANFFQVKANFIAAARHEIGKILSED